MQFRENADVFTPAGEKIGRLDRVVIDPGSFEVTHIVTQKGLQQENLFNVRFVPLVR